MSRLKKGGGGVAAVDAALPLPLSFHVLYICENYLRTSSRKGSLLYLTIGAHTLRGRVFVEKSCMISVLGRDLLEFSYDMIVAVEFLGEDSLKVKVEGGGWCWVLDEL